MISEDEQDESCPDYVGSLSVAAAAEADVITIEDDDEDEASRDEGEVASTGLLLGDTRRAPPQLKALQNGDAVYVTWVDNPHNFRVIPTVSTEQLQELTQQLSDFYSKYAEEVNNLV